MPAICRQQFYSYPSICQLCTSLFWYHLILFYTYQKILSTIRQKIISVSIEIHMINFLQPPSLGSFERLAVNLLRQG